LVVEELADITTHHQEHQEQLILDQEAAALLNQQDLAVQELSF
jgi:hypothetical protein